MSALDVPTPLAALVDALHRGDTLAWMLAHAPDGDAGAALQRAWATSDDPAAMIGLCAALGGLGCAAVFAVSRAHQRACNEWMDLDVAGGVPLPADVYCAAAIRRAVPDACVVLTEWLAERLAPSEVRP